MPADGTDHPLDLDALIGDLRREAARRRAEPAFPLDDEARVATALDEQSPGAAHDRLRVAARDIRSVGRSTPEEAAGRARGRGAAGRFAERLATLAELTANALLTVSTRLEDLERRLSILDLDRRDRTPGAGAVPPADHAWQNGVLQQLTAGRTLLYAADPEEAVGQLRARAVDGYGVAPVGVTVPRHPDVRQEDLFSHLESVGDLSLANAVLVGLTWDGGPTAFERLAAELHRTSASVLVLSEAPWAWRERVGPVASDQSADRPLSPESWLAALDRAGYTATAAYDPEGRSYAVTARRAP